MLTSRMASDVEQITTFLRAHPGKNFCSPCIAAGAQLTLMRVRDALRPLGHEAVLNETVGACRMCKRYTFVRGLTADTEQSPDDRIVELLSDDGGRRLCQTCITRGLALSMHVVQKAIWRLRASAIVSIDVGACASCQLPRVLLGRNNTFGR